VAILTMVTDAAHAMNHDHDVERVVCGQLTAALDADHGICFVPDTDDLRVLSSFPEGPPPSTRLLIRTRTQLAQGRYETPIVIDDPVLGQILMAVAPPPPSGDPAPRGVAFVKADGFGNADVELLAESLPPLGVLLPHAVAATARRERTEAGRVAAREFGLTERELEVLQLLAQGLLATSIASRLALSPRTVHKHLGNIYDKLGVHDRLVAVSLARRRGLVGA
jgi:DNA-binding CsgD family transcriptional regulator